MTDEQLLQEIDGILRTMPDRATLRHDRLENHSWFGRISAVINAWNASSMIILRGYLATWHGLDARAAGRALNQILVLLHQARNDLRMKTSGPLDVAVDAHRVYDYFDEIRKIISEAKSDILFVDPYLDAEFVEKYLVHIAGGVTVRLLAREKLKTLNPAVEASIAQEDANVSVRTANKFHDRYVIIDKMSCYQSGASFKDGAKNAPTTITQITDAFDAVLKTYEDFWDSATVAI